MTGPIPKRSSGQMLADISERILRSLRAYTYASLSNPTLADTIVNQALQEANRASASIIKAVDQAAALFAIAQRCLAAERDLDGHHDRLGAAVHEHAATIFAPTHLPEDQYCSERRRLAALLDHARPESLALLDRLLLAGGALRDEQDPAAAQLNYLAVRAELASSHRSRIRGDDEALLCYLAGALPHGAKDRLEARLIKDGGLQRRLASWCLRNLMIAELRRDATADSRIDSSFILADETKETGGGRRQRKVRSVYQTAQVKPGTTGHRPVVVAGKQTFGPVLIGLAVLLVAAMLMPSPSAGTPVQAITGDSWIDTRQPGTPRGLTAELLVGGPTRAQTWLALPAVKHDGRVVLRCQRITGTGTMYVRSLTAATWTEQGLTLDSAPAVPSSLTTIRVTVTDDPVWRLDCTDLVDRHRPVTLIIDAPVSAKPIVLAATESGDAPVLELLPP